MMQSFFALVLIPCMSAVSEPAGRAETVVYACPETAHFVYRDEGIYVTPQEYARDRHLTSGPRDDRMPPEVMPVKPQKVAQKAKKRSKAKRKTKKRRA